ncbi:MAG TPA: hypothetical protein VK184_18880 [Nostocaceae cyanobacterium]|nr:hypothetical protein [Nostocaceae cyanobacterium]
MAVKLINANISTQSLTYKPGGKPATFEVTVVNDGNQFASFQLEIVAAGSSSNLNANWYYITPAVSAKIPPGDITKFSITIIDTPVIGFVGKMNVIIRIFSLELRDEDRQLLRLIIEPGTESVPMRVDLPVREFAEQPRSMIEIPVRVFNPSQTTTTVSLQFVGETYNWILDPEIRLQLPPGEEARTAFICQIPVAEETFNKAYRFKIRATHPNGTPSESPEGAIKVLPAGIVDFRSYPNKRRIPESRVWLPQINTNSTSYQLEYLNASNIIQQAQVEITPGDEDQPKCEITLEPEMLEISPGETKQIEMIVKKRRHWLGLPQKLSFIAQAVVSDDQINVTNEQQVLKLTIHPILHPFVQIVLLILLLFLLWSVSWLNPENPFFGHQLSVTSVQFNGVGDKAVSGSQDQSIIRWNIRGFTNPFINQHDATLGKDIGKAVRAVRYKPVDNDIVASGLENGEIQLWDVTGGNNKPLSTFILNKDDRVFALEFSPNSNYLFSGHGSGLVLKWDINNALLTHAINPNETVRVEKPLEAAQAGDRVPSAVYSLALVGTEKESLVIGGRFNNLQVWNWRQNTSFKIPYIPAGSQEDYIYGLSSAEYKPSLLASADNQGKITLWNLQPCLNNRGECQILDQWSDGHGTKPVRSVALSSDGCYLVSGGDDNRVMLWPLTKEGKRASFTGTVVKTGRNKFNSVDIKVVKNRVLILSGDDLKRVIMDEVPANNTLCVQ